MTALECANSAQCAPYKHHFDECVERVTQQQEDADYKGPKEDCVEECKWLLFFITLGLLLWWLCQQYVPTHIEYLKKAIVITKLTSPALVFHLAHCASECAAPKLWKSLK